MVRPISASPPAKVEKDIEDLAGGALVTFVGKLGRLSRGMFIWVVTLLCGLEVQGLYSLTWGIVTTMNKVARCGLQRGVVRFVVEARTVGDQEGIERSLGAALAIGLAVSCLVAGGGTLAADWLAAFYEMPIARAVGIMVWTAPFLTAAWIFTSATRALRIMRFEVYVMSISIPLILLAGGLAVGFAGLGFEGIAWIQLAAVMGGSILAAHYFRRYFSLGNAVRKWGDQMPWKALGLFSLPVMLTDLIYSTLTQLDVLVLGWFLSQEQVYLVGLYALTRRMASVLLKAPQAFDPIFSSVVSELSFQDRQSELGERFVVISRWILTVNLPIFVSLALLGGNLLLELGGERSLSLASDIKTGGQILFLLCCGMTVQAVFAPIDPLLAMSGRPYLNLFNNILWLAANFLLNIWLIGRYGIVGAAWGAALAAVFVNLIRLVQIYVILGIFPFRRTQGKPLLAASAALLAGWSADSLLGHGGLVGVLVPLSAIGGSYVFVLYLLGIEAEDRALLARVGQRLKAWYRRYFTAIRRGPG